MIGWARGKRHNWRGRGRGRQVEAWTRWTLAAMPWLVLLGVLPGTVVPAQAEKPLPPGLLWVVLAVCVLACGLSSFMLRPALESHLGTGSMSFRGMAAVAAILAIPVVLAAALSTSHGRSGDVLASGVVAVGVAAAAVPYSLLVRTRTVVLTLLGLLVTYPLVLTAVGASTDAALGAAIGTGIGGAATSASSRCSAWYIAVMRELEEARDTQARLAVAEERLRFGRDLHDVLGRNLSAIALKSELALQLARRGSEAALDQMTEVQRIAHDSQREVRDVVRGYREADLSTELAGARAILRAAGIDCRTVGDDGLTALSSPVRAALGWVVREGTTNVLRHADARRCTVTLRADEREAVLTMENDGVKRPTTTDGSETGSAAVPVAVPDAGPGTDLDPDADLNPGADAGADAGAGAGSGLLGLRERLADLDGTLTAQPPPTDADGRRFCLTVRVPLPRGGPEAVAHAAEGARPQQETGATGEAR